MAEPLAHFITFSTYGTWLPGRDPGYVDRHNNEFGEPVLPPDSQLEARSRSLMTQPEYRLDEPRRRIVLQTISDHVMFRGWTLWAVHVRTNHLHVVVSTDRHPDKAMNELKAWSSRRLREQLGEPADRRRWTKHGSTKWLWTTDELRDRIDYTLDRQGVRLEHYDGSGALHGVD